MENEIMNYEEEVMVPEVEEETEEKNSNIGTGVAMLIGAGLGIATTAIVKLGKKLIAAHKAKKETKWFSEEDLEEVSDEK